MGNKRLFKKGDRVKILKTAFRHRGSFSFMDYKSAKACQMLDGTVRGYLSADINDIDYRTALVEIDGHALAYWLREWELEKE